MPYFVFHVDGEPQQAGALTLLASFEQYREARALAREKRAELGVGPEAVRLVFGETQELAEGLLRAPREEPILQEWEK